MTGTTAPTDIWEVSELLYSSPIHILEGNQVYQNFEHAVLPMIKLSEGGQRNQAGYDVLRNLILKRSDISLFDSEQTLERIIEYSGGNPRQLLRILHSAFALTETDMFDAAAVDKAICRIAVEFKRWLEPSDYRMLYEIDQEIEREQDVTRENHLLFHLALLEYNGFWRSSNPVIRELEGYRKLVALRKKE